MDDEDNMFPFSLLIVDDAQKEKRRKRGRKRRKGADTSFVV